VANFLDAAVLVEKRHAEPFKAGQIVPRSVPRRKVTQLDENRPRACFFYSATFNSTVMP
jgi:hypothetical protein